jgi:hypothetical protein
MRIADSGVIFDAAAAPADRRSTSFTSPLVLRDGRVVVCFRAGRTKDDPEENLILRTTRDGGQTWTTAFEGFERTVDGVPGGWRHGGLVEPEPGRLLGCFCWLDRSHPDWPIAHPETQGTLPSRIFVMESRDAGRTWSDRRAIDPGSFAGVVTTGPILPLADGALALPCEAWKAYHDPSPGTHHALLRLSRDGGRSFAETVVTATDPRGRTFFWDQRLAVDSRTGKVVALFWTHDRAAEHDLNVHVAWGTPDGLSWTAPVDTGLAGQIASPLVLPDGRLFAVYVHRHQPPTLCAVLSEDGGLTWDVAGQLVFYTSGAGAESGMAATREFGEYWADMIRWTFGHPEAALLPNGDVFVAFYGGTPAAMSARWVRIVV